MTLAVDSQGFRTAAGRDHRIPQLSQQPAPHIDDHFFVVDQQDRFLPLADRRGSRLRLSHHFALRRRKVKVERRPVVFFAVYVDVAAVALDDSISRRQAQPGASSHGFGGKKRLENSMKVLFIDAGAGIGDGGLHKSPRFHAVRLNVILIERNVLCDEI